MMYDVCYIMIDDGWLIIIGYLIDLNKFLKMVFKIIKKLFFNILFFFNYIY